MSEAGKVSKEKFNKFRQINRYLEFIEDTLKELQEKKLIGNSMKIIDFGCGKSYLTFALYHYLKISKSLISPFKNCNLLKFKSLAMVLQWLITSSFKSKPITSIFKFLIFFK